MREFKGLASFARFMEEQALTEPERLLMTAGATAMVLEKSVKDTYGDKSKLAPLSPDSTLQMREGDTPLLITGEKLRDSFESIHEAYGDGAVAGVGSSEPIVTYHEHGFVTAPNSMIPGKVVPPRPAFAIGVYLALPAVKQLIELLLPPGGVLRTLRGKFASLSRPGSMLTNAGNPADAIDTLKE
jgi:hypothetical protein